MQAPRIETWTGSERCLVGEEGKGREGKPRKVTQAQAHSTKRTHKQGVLTQSARPPSISHMYIGVELRFA
jgi:hypothetical protein